MPDNSIVRSFQSGGKTFDIPASEADLFLKDTPDAKEIRSFTSGKDTLDIPFEKVQEFLTDRPDAKPLHSYGDFKPEAEQPLTFMQKELRNKFPENYTEENSINPFEGRSITPEELSFGKTQQTGEKSKTIISDPYTIDPVDVFKEDNITSGVASAKQGDSEKYYNPAMDNVGGAQINSQKQKDESLLFSTAEEEKADLANNILRKSERQKNAVTGDGDNFGVTDALRDRNFWTLGSSDMSSMLYLKKIANKLEKNESLSDSDKLLLEAWNTSEQVNQQYPASDANIWYKTGKNITDMVPWLVQFAASRGTGTTVRKGIETTLRANAEKYLGTTIAKGLSKGLAETAGAYAAASLMPNTYADITRRTLGDTYKDDAGNIQFDGESADSNVKAIYKGWTNGMLEVLTERLGEGLGGMLVTKWPKSKLVKFIAGEGGTNATTNLSKFTKSVGWDGAPMEYFEEFVNTPLNALLVGDSKYSDVIDGKQQLETLMTVVVMGQAMKAVNSTQNKMASMRADRDYKSAKSLFNTEIDEDVRNLITDVLESDGSLEEQGSVLHELLSTLDGEKAGIALNYIVQNEQYNQRKQPTNGQALPDSAPQFTVNPRDTKAAELRQFAEGISSKDKGTIQAIELIAPEGTDNPHAYVVASHVGADGKTVYRTMNDQGEYGWASENTISGEVQEIGIDDFVNNQLGVYDQTTQQQELIKQNQINIDGKQYVLTGDQTEEGYIGLNPEDGSDITIPFNTVDAIRNSGQQNANVITETYGKAKVVGIKNEDGTTTIPEPSTLEQANNLKEQVEQATGGNATVQAELIPNEDVTAPQQFQLSIIPKVNEPINNQNDTATPSQDSKVSEEPTDELFSGETAQTEKKVITQAIGKDQIDFVENEDFDEVVPNDKMPLEKALPILEKKFKDHPKVVVVADRVQVEVPGKVIKGETKWDDDIVEPSTTKTVIKSIKIVPKEVIARQKQADTDILLDILDEFNATPESRENKQQASEIEAIAKRLGYQTDRNAMNQIRLFDNSGTISKPKVTKNENIENQNQENVSGIINQPIDNDILEKLINQESEPINQLQNEDSEKVIQPTAGIVAGEGENTPQAQQGEGVQEGLEENVNKIKSLADQVSNLPFNARVDNLPKAMYDLYNTVFGTNFNNYNDLSEHSKYELPGLSMNNPKSFVEDIQQTGAYKIKTADQPRVETVKNPLPETAGSAIISTGQPATVSKTADPVAEESVVKKSFTTEKTTNKSNSITGKAKEVEVAESDIQGLALQYFINGGMVKSNEILRMFKDSSSERGFRMSYTSNENGQTVNQIAHNIWEALPQNIQNGLSEMDVYNSVEKVIMEHISPISMAKAQLKRYSADPNQGYSEEWLNNQLKIEEEERLAEIEIWTNDLAQLEIIDQLPTENELIELFLPENTANGKQEINQRGSIGEDRPIDSNRNDQIGQNVQGSEPGVKGENESKDGKEVVKPTLDNLIEAGKKEVQEKKASKEEKPAPVYGANNKIVSNERAEELRKRLRDKLNNLNSGFDPELLAIGTELAAYHIESGARKFADFSRRMIEDVGEAIKPYLKSIYNGARDIPGMEEIEAEMTEYSEVKKADIDQILKQQPDVTTGDKKAFVASIKSKLGVEKLNIVSIRKIAAENGFADIKDTTLQEYVELAIIGKAKEIVSQNILQEEKYRQIVELYNSQPTISMRSSERIEKQQYSTPIPMSFLAGEFINAINPRSILEPSAGNGMMVFNTDQSKVIANEIDIVRLENLREQGFAQVTDQDGTAEFNIEPVDAVVTNPPFGRSEARDYKGYKISGLDEQMVVNALENLSETGRASIIIGGHTKYKSNGTLGGEKAFFNYLYNFYNVSDVINMDGGLYSKQGTSFETRLILINGRRTETSRVYAPLEKNTNTDIVTTFDELQQRVNKASNEKTILQPEIPERNGNGTGTRSGNGSRPSTEGTGTLDLFGTATGSNQPGSGQVSNDRPANQPERTPEPNDGNGRDSDVVDGNEGDDDAGNGGSDGRIQPKDTSKLLNGLDELAGDKVEIDLAKEKTPYPARSKSEQIGSVVPTNVAQTLADVLSVFKDIDEYVQIKLGYESKEELFNALAAEQVDSVAMAIYQIENGGALIIGDMTGVGKGRQAAAILRYAHLQGKKPIFVTEKAHLFSDIYRDLRDIGSADIKPFIFNSKSQNSDPTIVDENGTVIYAPLSEAVKKPIFQGGRIPAKFDYAVLTYSQLNAGINKVSAKKDFFSSIVEDNILVLDESHNAGGDGNTGTFMTNAIPAARGIVFLSGTFAKRADNMPIYALKTSMSEANMSNAELIEAIKTGGVPLQEIMSKNLTQSGQMIRRERDFTGVNIDWKTIEDADTHFKAYDSIIKVFNDLIQFQREYIDPIIEEKNEELAAMQAGAEHTAGTSDFGINNVPFASKTFNLTRQLLFSLKAKNIADEAIEELKAGRRPVIAVANTMEGFMNELGGIGEKISNYDFSTTLMKGLHGLFRFTETDGMGDHQNLVLTVDDLPKDAKDRYYEIEDFIKNMSVGISISPIDVIKDRIQKAGFSIGEMTGRSNELIFNPDGTAQIQKRTNTDKKKLTRDFNAGKINALIMNQSASTGISLHASSKVADQRQRIMLSAQTQLDVNTEVQMRGRIDRTGQVIRGAYRYILSPIPAEQRMTMMFKVKLKSLDANTTSSQKSKTNEIEIVDFLNKYGDKICVDHLKEDSELNEKLLDPMKFEGKSEADIETFVAPEGAALKIAGRVALLPINEQQKFYDEITEKYNTLINYLNDTNSNDLEITTLPLRAETKEKVVVAQGKGGISPFAQDSYRETVLIDVLKKPLKAEEIKKEIEKHTEGLGQSEYRNHLIEKLDSYTEGLIESEIKKSNYDFNSKEQARIDKANKIFYKQNIDDVEVLKQMLEDYLNASQKIHDTGLANRVDKIRRKADGIRRIFNMFPVGRVIMVPNTSDISTNTSYSDGVLMGYKLGAKLNPSTITAIFATLDSRRKIEVPLSKADFLNASYAETMQMRHRMTTTLDNWDEKIPTRNRRTGYIITGNILQAFAGNEGQLIAYTDIDGNIKEGILLPENYKANEQQMRVQIITKLENIKRGEIVRDISGNVTIRKQSGGGYSLEVPLSKQSGGMYFLDAGLRDLVIGRDFRQMGGRMVGAISEDNLENVLQYMSGKYNTSVNVDIAPAVKPRQTPATPEPKSPLMDVLDNGKQVVEIKRNQEQDPAKESTGSKLMPVEEFRHTQTNQQLWNVKINGRSDDYDKFSQIAKKHKPFTASKPWNRYSKGFLFNTKDDAIRFKNEVEGENNVQFRILGEYGASNLDKAEEATTRLDNLKVAREMEQAGKDAKTISLATGWEKGADGKWRYEVPDVKISKEVEKVLSKEWFSIFKTNDWFAEKLGYILQGDALFKSYPDLSNIKVEKLIGFKEAYGGNYNKEKNTISINASNIDDFTSILDHEIQHAIQEIEGFAKGGNPSMSLKVLAEKIKATVEQKPEYQELKKIIKEKSTGLAAWSYKNEQLVAKAKAQITNMPIKEAMKMLEKRTISEAQFEAYKRLAGEVEARNVQSRMNFTPEERRNTLLQETEDVSREDQIILMDGLGVSNSMNTKPSLAEVQNRIDELQSNAPSAAPIEIIADKNGLPEVIRNHKNFSNNVEAAWYNGRIYVLANKIKSIDDVVVLWIHENGIHNGIKNIVPKGELKQFMGMVYDSFLEAGKGNTQFQTIIDRINRDYKYATKEQKAEEMLAYLSEKIVTEQDLTPMEQSIWSKYLEMFRDFMRKLFNFNSNLLTEKQIVEITRFAVQSNFQENELAGSNQRGRGSLRKGEQSNLNGSEGSIGGQNENSTDNRGTSDIRSGRILDRNSTERTGLDRSIPLSDFLAEGKRVVSEKKLNEPESVYSKNNSNEAISNPQGNPQKASISGQQQPGTDGKFVNTDGSQWRIPTKGIEGETFTELKRILEARKFRKFDPQTFDRVFRKLTQPSQSVFDGKKQMGDNPFAIAMEIFDNLPKISYTEYQKNGVGFGIPEVSQEIKPDYPVYSSISDLRSAYSEGRISEDYYYEQKKILREKEYFNEPESNYKPNTILINGTPRSTLNSNGKPIANSEEGIRNFWKWFGDSKVVDGEGRPLVVYHGGAAGTTEFDPSRAGSVNTADWGKGIYFTPAKWVADGYREDAVLNSDKESDRLYEAMEKRANELGTTPMNVSIDLGFQSPGYNEISALRDKWIKHRDAAKKSGGEIYEAYLKIDNPLRHRYEEMTDPFLAESAKYYGNDGIIVTPMTEYVVFEPSQIKSATGNNGSFNPDDNNINFRVATREPLDTFLSNAAAAYQEKKQTRRNFAEVKEKVREFIQDRDLPIRRLEEAVKALGGKITDNMKPYRDMSLSYGRQETIYKNFSEKKMGPVIKTIAKIRKSGVSGLEVLPYMISKHAIERNAYMRAIELKEWKEAAELELQKWQEVNTGVPQGMKDRKVKEYQDELQAKQAELSKKDYSGVKGFDPSNTFENPDELAQTIVDEFEDKVSIGLVDELWENVKGASSEIVDYWRNGQTMSAEQAEQTKNRFKYFIPLRGWREGAAKQLTYKKGEGFSTSLKHAKGRTSFAENPLAYFQQVAFKAIGEQTDNEVNNALLNLVVGNYGDEFQKMYELKKAYYIKDGIDEDGSPMWKLTIDRPSEEMFKSGEAKTKIYEQYQKLRTPSQAHEHEVYIKRPGGDMVVIMKDQYLDVAQAMGKKNSMYRSIFGNEIHDAQDLNRIADIDLTFGLLPKMTLGGLNNWLKAMYTSLNVVFPLTNFQRDVPEAAITQFIKGEKGQNVVLNITNAFPAIVRNMRGKNGQGKYDELFRRFKLAGGNTGFTHQKTPEELEKEINSRLKMLNRKGSLRGYTTDQLKNVLSGVEAWNQMFEDATRFSVFITSVESGKTDKEAAYDAKEASVNFNRKGKSSKAFDSIWAFWNVAIQSAQKNFGLAKKYPKRFSIVAGSWVALGFLEAMLNDGADDDDEYYNISEYVRENYLIIPTMGDKYIRVPLPQFWRGFKSAGSLAYDVMNGKMDALSASGKGISNFMGGLLPIDIGGFYQKGEFSIAPLVPTIYRPIAEIDENRDYMGYTIVKEPFTKEQEKTLANSGLGKDNVSPAIKFFTDALFRSAGGQNETRFYTENGEIKKVPGFFDVNPSVIEHLLTGYTGGTGRFVNDALTTGMQAISTEKEVDFKNAPFINQFIKKIPEAKWKIIGEYYDLQSGGNESAFSALKKSLFQNEDKTKYIELASSEYYNRYKAISEMYDKRLTNEMEFMDFKTAEGSEKVTATMKEAIDAIKELKKEYKRK